MSALLAFKSAGLVLRSFSHDSANCISAAASETQPSTGLITKSTTNRINATGVSRAAPNAGP
ncbi:hypothetical protein D3C71_1288350 [compost metagenome]